MKWNPNMTEQQLAEFKAQLDALDAAYASAAAHDAAVQAAHPMPDQFEDEMEILRKAALSRGQP